MRIKPLAATIFLALSLPVLAAQDRLARVADAPSGLESSAAATVDQFHAALKGGNAKAAELLLDDKVVIYEEGEGELNRAQYAGGHLQADLAFASAVQEEIVRREDGRIGDIAWVATQGHLKGKYDGRDLDRETTETMVLLHSAAGWKIVHIHWSSKASTNH